MPQPQDSPRGGFFSFLFFYNSSVVNAKRSAKRSITVLPTATAAKYKRKKYNKKLICCHRHLRRLILKKNEFLFLLTPHYNFNGCLTVVAAASDGTVDIKCRRLVRQTMLFFFLVTRIILMFFLRILHSYIVRTSSINIFSCTMKTYFIFLNSFSIKCIYA